MIAPLPLLNRDTQLCISIAGQPGDFGVRVHNSGYRALGLNYVYKACGVEEGRLADAVAGVRALGVRGMSVSMPHKQAVLDHLDEVDEEARRIGAVNTVVNDHGRLTGYNTDAFGLFTCLEKMAPDPTGSVLVLGAGGMARAVVAALLRYGFSRVSVVNRSADRAAALAADFAIDRVDFSQRFQLQADILVNATSVGMVPEVAEIPFHPSQIEAAGLIVDVPTNPMVTRLVEAAEAAGRQVIPGHRISLWQAVRQFELYTGVEAPVAVMEQAVNELLAELTEPFQKQMPGK